MGKSTREMITVSAVVDAPIEKVWRCWTTPEDIMRWNNASDDWHTPSATNDVRPGGTFTYRMEARDGSFGFDFSGVYERVDAHQLISYALGDERKVKILFEEQGSQTKVIESFDAESRNPVEMQRDGWQAILNNFKMYVERCP
jgi:uncharacterized protein YndB with AHSA1/START domain